MNKEEIVDFMLDSINRDNREICEANGMPSDQIDMQIQQSQQSLSHMMSNLYTRMKEEGLLA
jgi:hypothetical protein